MAEKDLEASDIERKVHDLADAMGRVRSAQADRDDVVVDMKHAKLSRLELLAEELGAVRDDIPDEIEQFEFALTHGDPPRLWIDMTSFVRMAADGREYEFVKDTRLGRTVLGRSSNRNVIGARITDYVAERILERERMIEGDWLATKAAEPLPGESNEASPPEAPMTAETGHADDEPSAPVVQKQSGLKPFVWFLIGIALSGAAGVAIVMFDKVEPVVNLIRAAIAQIL